MQPHDPRGARPGGARRVPRRGGRRGRGREPRAGPRGEGHRPPGLPLALHRPAAVAQGQADPAVRRADPLGRVGVGAAPTRTARHAGDRDPARGQRRRRGGQGRRRSGRARGGDRRLSGPRRRPLDDAAVQRPDPRGPP